MYNVSRRQNFTLDIVVSSPAPVHAAQYNITFDPAVFTAINQSKGTFLISDGRPSVIVANNITSTYATYGETRIVRTGVVGEGTLATITFRVKEDAVPGNYTLSFKPEDTILADIFAEPIFITLSNATITITNNTPPVPIPRLKHIINNVGSPVYFDASGSYDDGSIVRYEWTFGDGTNATGMNVTHTYTTYNWDGAYHPFTVRLTVVDD